jgi:hypothetical protein
MHGDIQFFGLSQSEDLFSRGVENKTIENKRGFFNHLIVFCPFGTFRLIERN